LSPSLSPLQKPLPSLVTGCDPCERKEQAAEKAGEQLTKDPDAPVTMWAAGYSFLVMEKGKKIFICDPKINIYIGKSKLDWTLSTE